MYRAYRSAPSTRPQPIGLERGATFAGLSDEMDPFTKQYYNRLWRSQIPGTDLWVIFLSSEFREYFTYMYFCITGLNTSSIRQQFNTVAKQLEAGRRIVGTAWNTRNPSYV